MARKALSKKIRFEIFKRDNFTCQYCGCHPPDVLLEVDHIVPVAGGGMDDPDNLVTACFDCNRGKAARSLGVVPKSLDEKAKETQEREVQLAGYRKIMDARADRIENDAWIVAEVLSPGCSESGFNRDWLRSIKTFNERLPLHSVKDAADLAMGRKPYSDSQRFRYFCGICWNKINRGEE